MSLRDQDFERICIIKPSSLGDIIHALPVLHGLRQRFPQAHISWLVNNAYIPLLNGHPDLNEVIGFDRQALRTLRGCLGMSRSLWRYAGDLRRRRFDLAIDLQGLMRSALLTRATTAAVRLGFQPAREGAGFLYNHRIPAPALEEHAVERNYRVAGVLGFEDVPIKFHLPVQQAAQSRLNARLTDLGISLDERYLLVLPGSRWETKNWWPQRFASTIDHLAGQQAVLSGGLGERQLCEDIASRCKTTPQSLAGETTIEEMVALIAGATAVLCNDSGPLHIATALGVPAVAIFGPTSPDRTGPYGPSAKVLRHNLDCSPCYLRQLRQCPHDHACMEAISSASAAEALDAAVSATANSTKAH
jgi:lipopolysaccharide heptosyltransferase I